MVGVGDADLADQLDQPRDVLRLVERRHHQAHQGHLGRGAASLGCGVRCSVMLLSSPLCAGGVGSLARRAVARMRGGTGVPSAIVPAVRRRHLSRPEGDAVRARPRPAAASDTVLPGGDHARVSVPSSTSSGAPRSAARPAPCSTGTWRPSISGGVPGPGEAREVSSAPTLSAEGHRLTDVAGALVRGDRDRTGQGREAALGPAQRLGPRNVHVVGGLRELPHRGHSAARGADQRVLHRLVSARSRSASTTSDPRGFSQSVSQASGQVEPW